MRKQIVIGSQLGSSMALLAAIVEHERRETQDRVDLEAPPEPMTDTTPPVVVEAQTRQQRRAAQRAAVKKARTAEYFYTDD